MDFIAIDIETTGTLPYRDHIIEVAAVLFKNDRVVSTFEQLVNPKMNIPKEATDINGITNEMVASAPTIGGVLEDFASFCKDFILVAHNATFDFQFLSSAIKRLKTAAPRGPVLDTYSLAKKVMPGMNNYKLSTLAQSLKIKGDKFHRAGQDAVYCGHLFYHLTTKVKVSHWKQLATISGKNALVFPQIPRVTQQLDLF